LLHQRAGARLQRRIGEHLFVNCHGQTWRGGAQEQKESQENPGHF